LENILSNEIGNRHAGNGSINDDFVVGSIEGQELPSDGGSCVDFFGNGSSVRVNQLSNRVLGIGFSLDNIEFHVDTDSVSLEHQRLVGTDFHSSNSPASKVNVNCIRNCIISNAIVGYQRRSKSKSDFLEIEVIDCIVEDIIRLELNRPGIGGLAVVELGVACNNQFVFGKGFDVH